ncbi:23460_t:CDS:2 [Cetraspora pellucida]|uniref:23460_t:CDS:1 n=1 Tax=Cetraspora pellucida TaxID=1433469 RepID=A0A9N9I772_9GLOM|nr:23460_t:CDS:2 [Cetraspora pellucida]
MSRIHILSDIGEGNKLGDLPSNRYPPSQTELENLLNQVNYDREIAIEYKEKLTKHTYQLIDEVKRLRSELDTLTSQITRKDISLKESKIKIKDLLSKIKILEMKLSSTQNKSKEITALRSMKKILENKLESAQKDAFSTQEEIVKKESEIIFLKSKLINIKNELMNTKDELALKINEIECLGALCSASQKTKNILDPVIRGGTEKNTQSEEQSFISNSGDTSEESEIRGYALSKSFAKYFKSKNELVIKENETLPIITNKQNPESLIQDITIEGAVCASEALVNDNNIFHQTPPSCSLNSKPDYTHYMTASGNLFSKIYKPTMNEQIMDFQSIIQKNRKKELPSMKLFLMDIDEANKHVASRCQSHPASPTWPFRMIVTGKSGSGKTNILTNLFLDDKAEYIYKEKKGGRRYISCDNLIVCGYHPDEPKWAFVRYMYSIISKDPKAPYYENIRFSYISSETIPSIKAFSSE